MASNLTFYGSSCTKDCTGHNAGWKWRKANPNSTIRTNSTSFLNGAVIRDIQSTQGTNLIGTVARNIQTGRFQKIIKGR